MIDVTGHIQIFNPDEFSLPICIVGCGGMGSRIAEGLVRMGAGQTKPIYLFDHDLFERKNLANQFMFEDAISIPKVAALKCYLLGINPAARIQTFDEKVDKNTQLSGVVFLCLDSMNERAEIVEGIEQQNTIDCVIETRMDAGLGISHCFDPLVDNHCDCWWMYWYSDKEASVEAGCSSPQSIISAIYGTTMLALRQFEKYVQNGCSAIGIPNRLHQDFDDCYLAPPEVWPETAPT